MRYLLFFTVSLLLLPAMAFASPTAHGNKGFGPKHMPVPGYLGVQNEAVGLVKMESDFDVEQTAANLEALIGEKGLTLFTVVDHSDNAAGVGLELPPTVVYIFGNPNLGTPLMQEQRTVAIDLPQKMLIWEDDEGTTWIAYNDPMYLKWRHRLSEQAEVLESISSALQGLAEQAATQMQ